jgi:hypothetical protein
MARPLTEFNKYEALEMTEELQNAANDRNHPKERYYRVVYQTLREKMEVPPVQFRALLLRLLGDKDQERVSEMVSKVEKHFTRQRPRHVPPMTKCRDIRLAVVVAHLRGRMSVASIVIKLAIFSLIVFCDEEMDRSPATRGHFHNRTMHSINKLY